jgi:molybdopterin converting factor small subunit
LSFGSLSLWLTTMSAKARAGAQTAIEVTPVKVLFYGQLAETIGPELEIETPPGFSVAQLRERLIAAHPEAEQPLRNRRARACVGDAVVHEDHVLEAADRVEFLPPVSGG